MFMLNKLFESEFFCFFKMLPETNANYRILLFCRHATRTYNTSLPNIP